MGREFKVSAPSFYQILEEELVKVLGALKYPNGTPLAEKCKRYEGEFGGTFNIPESYEPDARYYLVNVLGSSFSGAGRSSIHTVAQGARVVVYAGSHNAGGVVSKDESFTMLESAEDLLNGYKPKHNGVELCTLVVEGDSQEFFTPNNICWGIVFKVLGERTLGSSNY